MTVLWFDAEFTNGRCGGPDCREPIVKGDLIGYVGDGTGRKVVRFKCCGENLDINPDGDELSGMDDEGIHRVHTVTSYIPPGRGRRDMCGTCFIIHTIPQGAECW